MTLGMTRKGRAESIPPARDSSDLLLATFPSLELGASFSMVNSHICPIS
ncbi:MAG: hypothetical protein ACI4QG_06225 [Candidatus Cryptobacteroides sp.]